MRPQATGRSRGLLHLGEQKDQQRSRALARVAAATGTRQILDVVCAAAGERDDVVDDRTIAAAVRARILPEDGRELGDIVPRVAHPRAATLGRSAIVRP